DSSTPGPPIGDPERATSKCLPSAASLIPRGRLPISSRCTTRPASGSTTTTALPVSSETYRRGPCPVSVPGPYDEEDGEDDRLQAPSSNAPAANRQRTFVAVGPAQA